MQFVAFNARCDVEIGDEVRVTFNDIITKITDIRTVHYLKDQRVEFEFKLECAPVLWFKREGFVYPDIKNVSDNDATPESRKSST